MASDRAKKISWVLIDVGDSAFSTTIAAAIFPVYLPSLLPKEGVDLNIFGMNWHTGAMSLWAYTVSLSLFLTFLMAPILAAWSDQAGKRKQLMGFFMIAGALATCMLGFTKVWYWALMWFAIANIGFSAGHNIFYNSLLAHVAPEKEWHKLSLQAFAWGYIGGGIVLAINLVMIMKHETFGFSSKQSGLEWSFISVGVWWLLLTLPALFCISEDPLVGEQNAKHTIRSRLNGLWETLKSLPKFPALLMFMLSFALFNDGIQTVISMASIFGKEVLSLKEETLIGTLLMIQFLGLPFTLSMNRLTTKVGAVRLLKLSLIVWIGIIAYSYSMNSAGDFWLLGVLVAIVLGVSQALPRSIFAAMIPEGRQAEFFSFFALSGKATSVLGPLTFGLVRDLTGNARISILSLGVFFIGGLILLHFVPHKLRHAEPVHKA